MPKKSKEDSWLRNNIFYTSCTIKEKICGVIIDGGNCKNVISQEAVEKLQLKTKRHPSPYKLSWFKKGNEITIHRCCLVSFSIREVYFDNVICDVVPEMGLITFYLADHGNMTSRPFMMDTVTHIHFRRLKRKQFSSLHERISSKSEPDKGDVNILSWVQFLEKVTENGIFYVLVGKEINSEIPQVIDRGVFGHSTK